MVPPALAGAPDAAQGTPTPATALALSGLSLVVGSGSVSAGSDATAALTGQSLTAARGSVVPTASLALSGQALSAARGSLVPAYALVLSSQTLVAARGIVAAFGVTTALTGQSAAAALGSITGSVTADVPPTEPYVPPTIAYGFRAQHPANVGWTAGGSSGATWNAEPDTPNEWTNGAGQTGANWKKS